MDRPHGRRRARLLAQALASAFMLALVSGLLASSALADGDPASDVLATQSLFLPQDAGISLAQQDQLTAMLLAATNSGYPIRVAIISSSTDLGSVTELWRQPQTYARFLGQELSLVYHGPLLVIMPDGFGLVSLNPAVPPDPSALAGVSIGQGGGSVLGTTALTAIQRLAGASGHSVPIPAAVAMTTPAGSNDTLPWIALAVGAVLVALAWTASLHVRPLHRSGRDPSST